MPIPLSTTSMASCGAAGVPAMRITTRTPPRSVNLSALPTRLVTIWRRRPGSDWMIAGIGPAASSPSVIPLSRALTPSTFTTSRSTWCGSHAMRSTSMRPASTFDRSRMSLISSTRCLPLEWIVSRCRRASRSFLPQPRFSTSVKPRMAFIGVRISWLMLARKSLFARFAASASSRAWRSSTFCSSSWVTSLRLISTPPVLPSPPATGEQLAWNMCSLPSASGR